MMHPWLSNLILSLFTYNKNAWDYWGRVSSTLPYQKMTTDSTIFTMTNIVAWENFFFFSGGFFPFFFLRELVSGLDLNLSIIQ